MSTARTTVRTAGVALRAMLLFTLVLGLGYTALITGIGQLVLPWQANGSTVQNSAGATVGSALIGQTWTDAEGTALPEYFQSRPSAAGDGYDGGASSGSNLGPENEDLVASIEERQAAVADIDGLSTGSGTGGRADPGRRGHRLGLGARSRTSAPSTPCFRSRASPRRAALPESEVRTLVEQHIQQRDLGYLGEPRVNVLELNLALDALSALTIDPWRARLHR